MAFSNAMGKIMKHQEEGNKATSSQTKVTGRGRRCPTEIKQLSAVGVRERSWMNWIPMSLERGTIAYVHAKERSLIWLPERLSLSLLMCISFTLRNLFLFETPAL